MRPVGLPRYRSGGIGGAAGSGGVAPPEPSLAASAPCRNEPQNSNQPGWVTSASMDSELMSCDVRRDCAATAVARRRRRRGGSVGRAQVRQLT